MPSSTLNLPQTSQVCEALAQNPIPALRRLSAQETEIAVVLDGDVPSYYLKQVAQEAVMPLLDGRQLLNRLRVVRPSERLAEASVQ
jgi:hypothetical protein